ncbi:MULTISPECIES: glycosyltransferase family 2 protein [Rhodobacterales]|nr:glycosyltransferase family 2 protein [Phaeobacter gallaeciensis]MDE4139952.1 glycosyltransferase [Phaeobacter gallaeciensis]MDE4148438.1 glycosyltransferase [Phaeobacter gallaeciensis]MDE4152617.1 glycosyltransferase [Phaeobacter gallaeciensis]MDE4228049.1 glycosyltransferase [Phaeobacter gallaeciensis]MDE4257081.1 glycosyltransferase [Phaeobacter gallaeciensis]
MLPRTTRSFEKGAQTSQGNKASDPDIFRYVELAKARPDPNLLHKMPPAFWLRNSAVPWMRLGDSIVVAMADLSQADRVKAQLRNAFGTVIPVLARKVQVQDLLTRTLRHRMVRRASHSVPSEMSSRFLAHGRLHMAIAVWLGMVLSLSILMPLFVFNALSAFAMALLLLFAGFRVIGLAGFLAERYRPPPQPRGRLRPDHLPRISVLVPLLKEAEISAALLHRLRKLRYPRHLLDVLLVLEEDDVVTLRAVQKARLPHWTRVIRVPAYADLTTKPRALNYALNYCHGDIIGVWDAEDAPQPDQLHRVAEAFAHAPPELACVQGVLDYYNPRASWIARCFTLEYASWFRIILKGIARMGLVVPLGGTTMFVRRDILDRVGGWDAHNVTEDADLGVRLFRAGYRTEMLASTTYEEANCRPWPWIKQRSRWLKGFMVTYCVHMRSPAQLFRDLGWRQFLGFQVFFLGSVGQFLLAPFLWSFWLVALGVPHPSAGTVPGGWLKLAVASLVIFEILNQTTAVIAAFVTGRRWLAPWAPCLLFYYPMGVVAAYKGFYELVFHPFFWDKTDHGIHAPDECPAPQAEDPEQTAPRNTAPTGP